MAKSTAKTPAEYLAAIPAARRAELERVREVVRRRLPPGYVEALRSGMIVYEVPLERYPDTYNGQPLWYAALAAEKNYLTLHLLTVYGSGPLKTKLEAGFRAAGKKLAMGKACIRFKAADDLALDVVGDVVASVPLERFVAVAQAARKR
jgi:hypothetical protein